MVGSALATKENREAIKLHCKENDMTKYEVVVTDTFGDELNYAWVRQATIEMLEGESDLALMRRAKKAVGYTGVRLRERCDGVYFVVGACIALTITQI